MLSFLQNLQYFTVRGEGIFKTPVGIFLPFTLVWQFSKKKHLNLALDHRCHLAIGKLNTYSTVAPEISVG